MDYVVIVKADGKYWLKLTNDRRSQIHAFRTETEAVRYFEDGYRSNHGRSYESSMSAAIHFMFFEVSVVGFAKLQDLLDTLKITEESNAFSIGNAAGYMKVVQVDQDAAATLWEQGVKPRLI